MANISTKNLLDLGMQENEAAAYLALLELGSATVTDVGRKAKMNRTTAYDVLERLSTNGLINKSVTAKKHVYLAEPPSRLKQYYENKKSKAEKYLKKVENLLPALKSIYKTELKPIIKFAEGKQEMINMYMHKLEAKDTVYSILNLKGYSEEFDEMGQSSSQERYKRGIKEKVLAVKNKTSLDWWKKVYSGRPKRQKNTEYRWVEADLKDYPNGEINIYDDTVLIMLTKPGENVAFEIKSRSFAAFLKMTFELAWVQTKNKDPIPSKQK